MNSPFDHMATQLAHVKPAFPTLPPRRADEGETPTERLRLALRDAKRELTAQQLATVADLERTAAVGALLKTDLAKGRVVRTARGYRWNDQHDEALEAEIKAAARLLRRHGYAVRKAA